MDDITLGGPSHDVTTDVTMIKTEGAFKRMILDEKKRKAVTLESPIVEPVLQTFTHLTPVKCMFLGAPLSKGQAMDNSLSSQCNDPERATSRLRQVTALDALVLLRASFSAPKLQHIMRASPRYDNEHMQKFDELLRTAISKIFNVLLSDDQWLQASLLVKNGGLGTRHASSLASLTFLASAVGTRDLQNQILHTDMIMLDSALDICQTLWQGRYGHLHALASPAK